MGHAAELLDEGAGQPVSLAVERVGAALVVRLGGDVDMLTVPTLHARLRQALAAANGTVLVDLADVRFLGSNGLRLLLDLQADLTCHNRQLRVVTGGARAVTRPLQITGLDRALHVYPDLSAALAADTGPEAGGQVG